MLTKCIVGVMVSMLEFGRLSQTKDFKLQKTGWLKIEIRCLSGTKCLPMDCQGRFWLENKITKNI